MRAAAIGIATATTLLTAGCAAVPFVLTTGGSSAEGTTAAPGTPAAGATSGATVGAPPSSEQVRHQPLTGPFGSGEYSHATFAIQKAELSNQDPLFWGTDDVAYGAQKTYLYATFKITNTSKENVFTFTPAQMLFQDSSGNSVAGERAGDFSGSALQPKTNKEITVGFELPQTADLETAKLRYGTKTVPMEFALLGATPATKEYPLVSTLRAPAVTLDGEHGSQCKATWTAKATKATVMVDLSDDYRVFSNDGGRAPEGSRWLEIIMDLSSKKPASCSNLLNSSLDEKNFELVVDGTPLPPSIKSHGTLSPAQSARGPVVFALPLTATSITLKIKGNETGDSAEIAIPTPKMPKMPGES